MRWKIRNDLLYNNLINTSVVFFKLILVEMLVIIFSLIFTIIVCVLTVILWTIGVTSHLSMLYFTDIIRLILESSNLMWEELPSLVHNYTVNFFNTYISKHNTITLIVKTINWSDVSIFTFCMYLIMALNIILFSSALLIITFIIFISFITTLVTVLSYIIYNLCTWIQTKLN